MNTAVIFLQLNVYIFHLSYVCFVSLGEKALDINMSLLIIHYDIEITIVFFYLRVDCSIGISKNKGPDGFGYILSGHAKEHCSGEPFQVRFWILCKLWPIFK